jgi:hypothetical protein
MPIGTHVDVHTQARMYARQTARRLLTVPQARRLAVCHLASWLDDLRTATLAEPCLSDQLSLSLIERVMPWIDAVHQTASWEPLPNRAGVELDPDMVTLYYLSFLGAIVMALVEGHPGFGHGPDCDACWYLGRCLAAIRATDALVSSTH